MDKLRGYHMCIVNDNYGDWRINEEDESLDLTLIRHLLTDDKIKTINHNEICWKGMDNPEAEQDGERYEKCDISFPCILIVDCKNPKNMKYRMIDGKHRMAKMKSKNINESSFYVLKFEEVKEYLEADNVSKVIDSTNKIYIFDVDGTLTPSRQPMTKEFAKFFDEWSSKNSFYLVTGSDLPKLKEQIPIAYIDRALGLFTCCGNQYYKKNKLIWDNKFKAPKKFIKLLEFILTDSLYPHRYGNHIEDRGSMINFSVVGRDCTQEQRDEYFKWDNENGERESIVRYIKQEWPKLDASIGGQISIDIYPKGKDKSQVLEPLEKKYNCLDSDSENVIIFLGDRIADGGNDFPLAYKMSNTDGHYIPLNIKDWKDTRRLLKEFGYYEECEFCHGSGKIEDGNCSSCIEDKEKKHKKILEKLGD